MDTQTGVEGLHSVGASAPMHPLSQEQATAYAVALGERIRTCRGSMSRKEFGDKLRVHVNTVGKLERGETQPDAFLLMQISEIGNCPVEWLVTGKKSEA